METNIFSGQLMKFGLTRQEAGIYECLLREGKNTGYEVAKQLGISRSNAYNSLASMVDKGAVCLSEEGTAKKYVPVALEEFCRNYLRRLEEARRWLLDHKPDEAEHAEGFITIEGAQNILDKTRNILAKIEQKVYLSCTRNVLLLLVEELERLTAFHKKVMIITDHPVRIQNAKVYVGGPRGMEIGVIADSRYAITGEFGEGSRNTCLYSGQAPFVEVYKRSFVNEVKLLKIREERAARRMKYHEEKTVRDKSATGQDDTGISDAVSFI